MRLIQVVSCMLLVGMTFSPVSEEQTDTFAIVGSPDTFGNGRADVYGDQLGTAFLVVILGYSVRNLGPVMLSLNVVI